MMPRLYQQGRGVALVAVLWAVTLLSIMAGSFTLTLQRDSGLLTTTQGRARGLALADAGVHYAMLMQSLPDPTKRWRSDGRPYQIQFPEGMVRVRLYDEGGKIDLNATQEATLLPLLRRFTGNDDTAAAVAGAILDWRDADDLAHPHGAEAKEYQADGKAYGPPNRNFQALEELQMVKGMTADLYTRMEPLLTLYTGQDGINPAKASREVLLALPGMDEKTVNEYLEARRAVPQNMPAPPLPVQPGGIRLLGTSDMAYTVLAESKLPEGETFGLRVVIRRQRGRGGAPFAIVGRRTLTADRNAQLPPESVPVR
ncbi:MAG: type secretion system protein [Proteobacteria bacterium]|nr:type secretion system protein [Pseudomonadota bacterium]